MRLTKWLCGEMVRWLDGEMVGWLDGEMVGEGLTLLIEIEIDEVALR